MNLALYDPRAMARLEAAFDAYWAAPLGQLNVTADELRNAAYAAGYVWGEGADHVGPCQWARERVKTLRAAREAEGR